MHELIVSPFLGNHLVVRPGRRNGVKIPYARYQELTQAIPGGMIPVWLAGAANRAWDLDLSGRPVTGTVLVRPQSPFGYGHTFFHVDPHGQASICKVGRDPQISLLDEGVEGLGRLGGIADALLLRQGGCTGCAVSGTCGTCMPLVQLYRKAKAPLITYCQHKERKEDVG
ncbi:MAG: hypothetical protein ACRDTF_23250 [Pseudonocardiaceae bacterium]